MAHLVGQHGVGDVGVLEREGAAEAAARVGGGQFDEVDALHRAQQPERAVADAQHAQGVTGGVVGDAVREVRADVGDAEHVDEEFRQFVHRGRHLLDRLGEGGVPVLGGDRPVVVAHHVGARPGGGDDGVVAREGLGEPAHHGQGLGAVAGVEVHLAAAGLPLRELHGVAEAFQ